MTALERELSRTLKLQEEVFKQEMTTISKHYIEKLNKIATSYSAQIIDVTSVMRRQELIIEKYENESENTHEEIERTLSNIESISNDLSYFLSSKQRKEFETIFEKQTEELQVLARRLDALNQE